VLKKFTNERHIGPPEISVHSHLLMSWCTFFICFTCVLHLRALITHVFGGQ